jgi:lipopolysaccharide biosynthesis protein
MTRRMRLIAFYLPQFHPIPENDGWWGKGFTEWTNTVKAKPMFRGHYQPHIPADLGFYDLRVSETREEQAALARAYGIEGFCYYHYWFAGRRILERPLEEVVASGAPDFPFCVCWANQTWTGIWHGAPDRVLIEQTYPGERDHRAHFDYLLPMLTDRRQVTVNGLPLLLIYNPSEIPNVRRFTDLWRDLAIKAGLPGLHLVAITVDHKWSSIQSAFDGCASQKLPNVHGWVSKRHPIQWTKQKLEDVRKMPTIRPYEDAFGESMPGTVGGAINYPLVIHAWDNTPRSGRNGLVLQGSSPELFRRVLRRALDMRSEAPPEERLVFLKSWNEWAEGNHLEPDLKFGHGYLDVIRQEMSR